ncbi:carbon catabolite repressor protein 4 homolog 6-like isoform X2 [Nymphaea colorata]|nr:carbon catabolite repressor protein 4 homolog 6-like isoform X2 [Nymphaea colorata]
MRPTLYGVFVELADCRMSYPRSPFRGRGRWRGGGSRGFSGGGPNEEVFGEPGFRRGRGGDFGVRQGENGGFAYRGRGGSFIGAPRMQFRPRPPRRTDDYRHWEYAATLPPSDSEQFVVVSYNILADYLARDHQMKLYDHIPPHILDWEWRKSRILMELGLWGPDIMCLQEVDRFQELQEELKFRGYSGTWKMRTGLPVDGCAMFWRYDRFVLAHEENIEFNQLGLRDNVAQICVLESKSQSQAEIGSGSSSASFHWAKKPKRLVVCNIHVHYNPNRGEIKLGQVRVLLNRAHVVSRLWDDAPVVVCGDFNCTPESPLYKFISQQKLELSGLSRKEISGQYSAHVGLPVLDYNRDLHRSQASPYIQGSGPTAGNLSYMKEICNQPIESNIRHASSLGCLSENERINAAPDTADVIPAAMHDKDDHVNLCSVELKIEGEKLPLNDVGKSEEPCQSLEATSEMADPRNILLDTDIGMQDLSLSSLEDKEGPEAGLGSTQISRSPRSFNSSTPSVQQMTDLSFGLVEKIESVDNAGPRDRESEAMQEKTHVKCENSSVLESDFMTNFIKQNADMPIFGESTELCDTRLSGCDQEVHEAVLDLHSSSVDYVSTSDASCSLELTSNPRNAADLLQESEQSCERNAEYEELYLERSEVSACTTVTNSSSSVDNIVSGDGEIDFIMDGLTSSLDSRLRSLEVTSQGEPFIPTGHGDDAVKKDYDPHIWSSTEIEAATGNAECPCAEHQLQLRSVYTEVKDFSGTRGLSREPEVTSYNRRFMGTVDYIWRSEGLQTIKVLGTLPKHILQRTRGFPTHKWGSDHLALACQLAFKNDYQSLKMYEDSDAR